MTDQPTDSFSPLSLQEADLIARQTSINRMGVIQASDGLFYLVHVGKHVRVHLLPYQLTKRGILAAVAENDPWPEK